VISVTCCAGNHWHKGVKEHGGVVMRKLFILAALVFALVSGATATVVATTLQSQAMSAGPTRTECVRKISARFGVIQAPYSGSAALSTQIPRAVAAWVASGAGRKKRYREHDLTHLVSDGHQQVGIIVSAIGPQLSHHVTSVVERGRNII
jgi:hypothetical protein